MLHTTETYIEALSRGSNTARLHGDGMGALAHVEVLVEVIWSNERLHGQRVDAPAEVALAVARAVLDGLPIDKEAEPTCLPTASHGIPGHIRVVDLFPAGFALGLERVRSLCDVLPAARRTRVLEPALVREADSGREA